MTAYEAEAVGITPDDVHKNLGGAQPVPTSGSFAA